MNRQHHVPARFLLHVMKECSELFFAPPRLNVPRRLGLSDYDEMLGYGIHIRTIPADLRWIAIGSR